MMPDFSSVFSSLGAHPLIVLLVFAIVTAAMLSVLSGGRLGEAIGGIFRVFLTIFTTPFLFLRDVLTTIRTSGEEEQHYERTRLFMLFRSNRIFYLVILLGCLFALAAGATSAVLALYPQYEIEQGRMYSERMRTIRAEIREAEGEVANAGSPTARQQLETRRNETAAAYQQQVTSNQQFVANAGWPTYFAQNLGSARSQSQVERYIATIESHLAGCPRNQYEFPSYTQQTCDAYRTYLSELSDRRLAEFRLQTAAQEAADAFNNADNAAQIANNRLTALRADLESTRTAANEVSLFNPRWLFNRLMAALSIVVGTALTVIFLVWAGALIIDFWNWLILIMRAMEKTATEKLEGDGPSYPRPHFDPHGSGPPPNYPSYTRE